jgi:hypothetical protein
MEMVRLALSFQAREAREAAESSSPLAFVRQRPASVFRRSASNQRFAIFGCLFGLSLLNLKSRSRSSNKHSLNQYQSSNELKTAKDKSTLIMSDLIEFPNHVRNLQQRIGFS